ncbi:MAG: T9SS type A sorting domain-containing protein [Brumimicrobium sp.]
MNVLLNNPPYKIRVMDDDSDNLWGTADDNCINGDENDNTTTISLPSVNTFGSYMQVASNQSLNFNYIIEKDTSIVTTYDVVKVFGNPDIPVLNVNGTLDEVVSISTDDLGHVYHWTLNGQRVYEANSTEIFPESTGEYAVIAVNEHGCYTISDLIDVSGISSIDEYEIVDFNIYPNPANHEVNINFSESMSGDLMISDLFGKMVYIQNMNGENNLTIDVSSLASGVYTITTKMNEGGTLVKKLIIK